jgi:hypothetical protein
VKTIGFAALAVFCLNIAAAHACDVPFIRWSNKVNNGIMTVASGKPCKIYFRSAGPTPHVSIVQRPSNGSVSVGEVSTIVYQSRAGFVGSDSFAYSRKGKNARNRSVNITIWIAVTVTR